MSESPTHFVNKAQTVADYNARFSEHDPFILCSQDTSSDAMTEMQEGPMDLLLEVFIEWGGNEDQLQRMLAGERVTLSWHKRVSPSRDTVDEISIERRFSHWWVERPI